MLGCVYINDMKLQVKSSQWDSLREEVRERKGELEKSSLTRCCFTHARGAGVHGHSSLHVRYFRIGAVMYFFNVFNLEIKVFVYKIY